MTGSLLTDKVNYLIANTHARVIGRSINRLFNKENAASVKAADLKKGDKIEAYDKKEKLFYKATVLSVTGNRIKIKWADGTGEATVFEKDVWVPDNFLKKKGVAPAKKAADKKPAAKTAAPKKVASNKKKYDFWQLYDVPKTSPPEGTVKEDFIQPNFDDKDKAVKTLKLLKTSRFGWVISTLPISKGKAGRSDRTYGITMNGTVVRVGNGPHVEDEGKLYVRKSRENALKKFTDLYDKGMSTAGDIRDRISSRRAQGQQMRKEGRLSWMWDT